ncbi:Uncharacterised protein [Slackia heliotrinireducens]|uniref:hypothetical protein n=1 Tax=Slackia heliotrinireducens TaxID=84110 RepID=UPI00059B8662|nr:hypothetical protein [Slackia heliotrinireducens]VEG98834.1 Uncharacterised protein [Slackia heliotrinireducens]
MDRSIVGAGMWAILITTPLLTQSFVNLSPEVIFSSVCGSCICAFVYAGLESPCNSCYGIVSSIFFSPLQLTMDDFVASLIVWPTVFIVYLAACVCCCARKPGNARRWFASGSALMALLILVSRILAVVGVGSTPHYAVLSASAVLFSASCCFIDFKISKDRELLPYAIVSVVAAAAIVAILLMA